MANGEGVNGGRIEALNSAVRSIVTLALVGGFVLGFWFKMISGEVYTAIVSGVVGFWFAARQGEQAAKAALDAVSTKANDPAAKTTEPLNPQP